MKKPSDILKAILIVAFITVNCATINAQTILTQLNPLPHADLINDIVLRDSLHIFIVGGIGKIAYSNDGGAQWTLKYQNSNVTLKSIAFADSNRGICVGEDGIILRTTDSGLTWTPVNSGTSNDLNSVFFCNNTLGYIVGNSGTILFTGDAGVTWTPQVSGTSFDLNVISFILPNVGYIAGDYGMVFKTIDGTNWTYTSYLGTIDLFALNVINDSTVIVGGNNGVIKKTVTSGATWITCTIAGSSENVKDMAFIPGTSRGLAVCCSGKVLVTTNNGLFWSEQTIGTSNDIYSICYQNTNNIWIAGDLGSIFRTTDQGVSFIPVSSGVTERLNAVFFTSDSIGYVGGNNAVLLKTTDAGNSWTSIEVNLPSTGNWGDINSLYFFDDSTGIAVANSSTVLYIYNGGDSITQFSFGYTGISEKLCKVHFINRDTGFIAPAFMNILRSIDGGTSWQPMNTTSGSPVYSEICFPDMNTGYFTAFFGGADETFKKTSDCGVTWTTLGFGGAAFYGMDFITPNKGLACLNSTLYLTNDGGSNWTVVFSGAPLRDIEFVNASVVFGVGDDGKVLQSHNGGLGWSYVDFVTTCNLKGLCFTPSGYGYAVGENGTIIRIHDYSLVAENNNYNARTPEISIFPNPSSGEFNIRFSLTAQSSAKIIVYNLSGGSVYEHYCGILMPGIYQYPVSLNKLSSGIIIVNLVLDGKSVSRKIMINK